MNRPQPLQENERVALCACGRRFGQHRWATLACPNPLWRTGNGQSQWLTTTFQQLRHLPSAVCP